MILAYETSTDVCSVAYQNKEGAIFEKRIQGESVHSDNLFLFTQELMKEHGCTIDKMEAVLVSNGPGSYTGLRIATSAIKGIFFKTDTQVYQVETLAGLACSLMGENQRIIHSIIDARRSHVYHKKFRVDDNLETITELQLLQISEMESILKKGHKIVGTGLDRISADKLRGIEIFGSKNISAKNLLVLYNRFFNSRYIKKIPLNKLVPTYFNSNQVNNSKV